MTITTLHRNIATACLPLVAREDYVAALVRLHALLKSGGKIVLFTTDWKEQVTPTPTSYTVGSQEFFEISFLSPWNRPDFAM